MNSTEQKDINDLADEDLVNIFKHLPPYERLLVSEVSKRWYGISRIPWRDVDHLDLSLIPGENIGAIVKHSPNLRTVFAKGKQFALNELNILSQANLSSLKLYQCSSVISEPQTESIPLFSATFTDNLTTASWKEQVLYCVDFVVDRKTEKRYVLGALPTSLERLQLNALDVILPPDDSVVSRLGAGMFMNCLWPLRQLTCLILCSSSDRPEFMFDWELPLQELQLDSLRELCVDLGKTFCSFETLAVDLPRLEILFLNNADNNAVYIADDEAEQLAAKHPVLRILCITGSFQDECTFPIRRRYPNGFAADPVPLLHVFVGKEPSEKIIFTKSSANALAVHPITEPLPEFLAKDEIATLLEGVWIAAQIKEGAKHGSNWWKYEGDIATSFLTADDV